MAVVVVVAVAAFLSLLWVPFLYEFILHRIYSGLLVSSHIVQNFSFNGDSSNSNAETANKIIFFVASHFLLVVDVVCVCLSHSCYLCCF